MKVSVRFELVTDLHDSKRLVNYAEQGWKIAELDECLSAMVTLVKDDEVDTGYYTPRMYAEAINRMSNGYLHVSEYYYKDDYGNFHDFKLNKNGDFEEDT
jgi:hypothetical protein